MERSCIYHVRFGDVLHEIKKKVPMMYGAEFKCHIKTQFHLHNGHYQILLSGKCIKQKDIVYSGDNYEYLVVERKKRKSNVTKLKNLAISEPFANEFVNFCSYQD